MENKNLLNLIITLIVGIIITGAVLIPVVNDASQKFESTEKNQENVSVYMDKVTEFTLYQDHTDYTVYLNGEAMDLVGGTTIMVSDKVMVNATVVSSSVTTKPTMSIWAPGINTATVGGGGLTSDITVQLENGIISLTYGSPETTVTFDVEYAYLSAAESGDYALVDAAYVTAAQVNKGDTVTLFAMKGWWSTSYPPVQIIANDGIVTVEGKSYASNDTTTGTDVTINVEFTTEKYDNLTITTISENTLSAIIPATYTAYVNTSISDIMSIIPILVIVGLIVSIVGMFVTRRE